MSNSGTLDRAGKDRTDLYSDITHTIIKQLEAGRLPWVQPWGKVEGGAELGLPMNASTCRAYSGINILILWGAVFERGFTGQSWLTFKQPWISAAMSARANAAPRLFMPIPSSLKRNA